MLRFLPACLLMAKCLASNECVAQQAESQARVATGSPPSRDVQETAPQADRDPVQEPEVLLVVPAGVGGAVEEAALRIRAELRAVGFSVVRRTFDPEVAVADQSAASTYGRLALVRDGQRVEIRASAPGLEAPLTQAIDLEGTATTPEVIAIRSVEALRAAMLQSLRHEPPERPVPQAVRDFTRWNENNATRDATTKETKKPTPQKDTVPEQAPSWKPLELMATLGPLVRTESSHASTAVGAELQMLANWHGLLAGLLLDGTVPPTRLETAEGSIEGRQLAVMGRLGWSLRPFHPWELQVGAAAGYVRHRFEAHPEPGFAGDVAVHHTFAVHADVAVGVWPAETFGVFLHGRVGGPTDAPSFVVPPESSAGDAATDVVRFGRPTSVVSLFAAWRFL